MVCHFYLKLYMLAPHSVRTTGSDAPEGTIADLMDLRETMASYPQTQPTDPQTKPYPVSELYLTLSPTKANQQPSLQSDPVSTHTYPRSHPSYYSQLTKPLTLPPPT